MSKIDENRDKDKPPNNAQNTFNDLELIINSVPCHFCIKDRNNRFIAVNKAKASFYGKKPRDFIGKTDFDFLPEEKASEYLEKANRVIKEGRPITDIAKKVIGSNKETWISNEISPYYDKSKNILGTIWISRDVTLEKKTQDKFMIREKSFFTPLMDNIPDSIYFKDRDSRFVLINKALARKFKLKSPEEAIGKTDFDFFDEKYARPRYEGEQSVIKTGKPLIEQDKIEVFEGEPERWVSAIKVPWYDENNQIIGIFGITRDITEKKKAEEKIKYLSFHDVLTGLYNRAYFEEELTRLDTERQLPLTIVMGDLNGLKGINDAYGHTKGDIFLQRIAEILKECFRKEDIVSRWGGDEFIAILPKTTCSDAESIVKRIRESCIKRSTVEIPLSISFGISTKKYPEENITDIVKSAEDRMYKNKVMDTRTVQNNFIESLKENLKKTDCRSDARIMKMENYALLIGKQLNLPRAKLDELKLLLNLHNIGKLALADEIMSKKGKLSNEEWMIIKRLPLTGFRIAESSPKLRPIAECILSHHEWYNGSGYPRGLKGKDIPLLSRISFLVNSYEAMICERPYKKTMTKKEAIEEIKRCSGTQFDPDVAKTFIEILEKENEAN